MSSLVVRAIEMLTGARPAETALAYAGPAGGGDSPVFERPACPICGAVRATPMALASDEWIPDGAARGMRFSVVRCAVCSVRYTTPRYRIEHRRQAYEGSFPFYERARRDDGSASGHLETAASALGGRAKLISRFAPRPGRLLDLGCGDGVFAHAMRSRGWDVVGVDAELDVVRYARERLGLDCRLLDCDDSPLPRGPFDVITLWGLLPMVYRPQRLLERAGATLAPDGLVAVGVPNIRSAGARMFGRHWRGLGVPRHLTHFTPTTLTRTVRWAGFEPVALDFETPRWMTAGSVDAGVSGPRHLRRVARWAAHVVSFARPFRATPLADTMILVARRSAPSVAVEPGIEAGIADEEYLRSVSARSA